MFKTKYGIMVLFVIILIIFWDNKNINKTNIEIDSMIKTEIKEEAKKIEEFKKTEKALKEETTIYSEETETTIYSEEVEDNLLDQIKIEEINTITLPDVFDLGDVSFFSQAPYGNRDYPYQEACEEASFLIAYYYIKNLYPTKEQYHSDLLDFIELEKKILGYYEDTTVESLISVINKRDSNIQLYTIQNPSIQDIETELYKGNIIVAPFYGKALKNPYYSGDGPNYHMMTIKGYDKENFIVHDVGTRHGENWKYNKDLIISNIHDRNPTNMKLGESIIIVFAKN